MDRPISPGASMGEDSGADSGVVFDRHRMITCLAAFHYVAREGSISAAAQELGLNRNSLSRYLNELEQAISGSRLRDPGAEGRGPALTEAGSHLAGLLDPLFTQLERVSAKLMGGLAELRLGCQSSTSCYLLPEWIQAFGAERLRSDPQEPESPRFSLKTGSSESIVEALSGLEIDLGIVATDSGRARIEGGIRYRPLFRESLIAVCHRSHPLAASTEPIPADRFVRHPQYLYYRGGDRYQEHINALAPGNGAVRQMEFDTIAAIKETVRAGLGVSILPSGAIRGDDAGWIVRLPLEAPPERARWLLRAIAVVTRADDELTRLGREFLQFLQSRASNLSGTP